MYEYIPFRYMETPLHTLAIHSGRARLQRLARAKERVCTGGAPGREGGFFSFVTALMVAR